MRADEGIVPVEFHLTRLPQGDLLIGGRDVSHWLETHAELRAIQEQHFSLFEGASDVVFVQDLAGQFTAVNRGAERFLGYPAASCSP